MRWTGEAEAAIRKVPFFVRKKVRARVEKEAGERGKVRVTLADVDATKARYLSGMESEIKGFRIDACFGSGECPHRALDGRGLVRKLEDLLEGADLLGFLKDRVSGSLKFHHEFTVTLAECPNACSQPQIRDVGIIGAAEPGITDQDCTFCDGCVDACREDAVEMDASGNGPRLDMARCLYCGQCAAACPTGTLETGRTGFRVMLGGKLGRHPRLARELPGLYSERDVIDIVAKCIDFYKNNSKKGERFAAILKDSDIDALFNKNYPHGNDSGH